MEMETAEVTEYVAEVKIEEPMETIEVTEYVTKVEVEIVEPVYWEVIEKLLHQLVKSGVDGELACEIVTRVQIDLPNDLTSTAIDALVSQHAGEFVQMIKRVRRMIDPLFSTSHSPSLHRLPATLIMMICNLASRYQISFAQ